MGISFTQIMDVATYSAGTTQISIKVARDVARGRRIVRPPRTAESMVQCNRK